jgi:hypothetical protein
MGCQLDGGGNLQFGNFPLKPPFPTLSLLCLFQKERILYLSKSHTTQQMCKDWEGGGGGGFGGGGGGGGGGRAQPRIWGPFLLDILDLGGQNINIKY